MCSTKSESPFITGVYNIHLDLHMTLVRVVFVVLCRMKACQFPPLLTRERGKGLLTQVNYG